MALKECKVSWSYCHCSAPPKDAPAGSSLRSAIDNFHQKSVEPLRDRFSTSVLFLAEAALQFFPFAASILACSSFAADPRLEKGFKAPQICNPAPQSNPLRTARLCLDNIQSVTTTKSCKKRARPAAKGKTRGGLAREGERGPPGARADGWAFSLQMVNIPKTRRTYCKGKQCRKHTCVTFFAASRFKYAG